MTLIGTGFPKFGRCVSFMYWKILWYFLRFDGERRKFLQKLNQPGHSFCYNQWYCGTQRVSHKTNHNNGEENRNLCEEPLFYLAGSVIFRTPSNLTFNLHINQNLFISLNPRPYHWVPTISSFVHILRRV